MGEAEREGNSIHVSYNELFGLKCCCPHRVVCLSLAKNYFSQESQLLRCAALCLTTAHKSAATLQLELELELEKQIKSKLLQSLGTECKAQNNSNSLEKKTRGKLFVAPLSRLRHRYHHWAFIIAGTVYPTAILPFLLSTPLFLFLLQSPHLCFGY